MKNFNPFFRRWENIYLLPVIHYNLESAIITRKAFLEINPDCVAVELPETLHEPLTQGASRLPDISIISAKSEPGELLYYLCEPCEPTFEGVRSALEGGKATACIDLDVEGYPEFGDLLPDPYALGQIGLERYYRAYIKTLPSPSSQDVEREEHMAKRLKALSFQYDKILFIGGMAHIERLTHLLAKNAFKTALPAKRTEIKLSTLTEKSMREVMGECGYFTTAFESWRSGQAPLPDRREKILTLYKAAGEVYTEKTGHPFLHYHLRNTMKFSRNYALISGRLTPDLFQMLSAAKGCVDHNYAYEAFILATDYPFLKNIDNLEPLDLTVEEVWKHSRLLRFHLKQESPKKLGFKKRKDPKQFRLQPPGMFGLCSHQPEDKKVENFGDFLRKKGVELLREEASRTLPFSTSIEDGIDIRETIRHWHEKKLYIKIKGKPPGAVGSVVVIFNADSPDPESREEERYPWKLTWLGEHEQESDMAFYATPVHAHIVGPGISRCEYGGFMMTYPPRRVSEVWADVDYETLRNKPEVLLAAAIDYCVDNLVVYVAKDPPPSRLKSYASFQGKKVVYIPIGTLSNVTLNKIRVFHVLDGYDKRDIADEFIF